MIIATIAQGVHCLGDRLVTAATTVPPLHDWVVSLILLGLYAALAFPIGFHTRLLHWEPVTSWSTILLSTLIALIFPSLFEEALFRVLLLPHPSEGAAMGAIALWSGISLVLFILAHPLNGLLVMTSRRSTFFDSTFLTLAGLLGGVCTLSYLQSGSLWPPVVLHWVVVVIWLLCLGGDRRMSGKPHSPQPSE